MPNTDFQGNAKLNEGINLERGTAKAIWHAPTCSQHALPLSQTCTISFMPTSFARNCSSSTAQQVTITSHSSSSNAVLCTTTTTTTALPSHQPAAHNHNTTALPVVHYYSQLRQALTACERFKLQRSCTCCQLRVARPCTSHAKCLVPEHAHRTLHYYSSAGGNEERSS